MRPEPPRGGGAPPAPFARSGEYLCLCCARETGARFLGLRCADAGHPPGLFSG